MPWTGDWSDVTGRLKGGTAEQIRQALVERAPIAGVTTPARLAAPIAGQLSLDLAEAIDTFFDDIVGAGVFFDHRVNGGVFSGPGATVSHALAGGRGRPEDQVDIIQAWTEADLLTAIGSGAREITTAGTLKAGAWAEQLHDMINLLLWSFAQNGGHGQIQSGTPSSVPITVAHVTPLESRAGQGLPYPGEAIIAYNAAPWIPGMFVGSPFDTATPQHFESKFESRIVRVKTDYRMSDYVLTTANLNHQSQLVIPFDRAIRRTGSSAAYGPYQNNDYPGIPVAQLVSWHTDAAPNRDNTFDVPRIGAFDPITVSVSPPVSLYAFRAGWELAIAEALILSNWNVAGGLEFVA